MLKFWQKLYFSSTKLCRNQFETTVFNKSGYYIVPSPFTAFLYPQTLLLDYPLTLNVNTFELSYFYLKLSHLTTMSTLKYQMSYLFSLVDIYWKTGLFLTFVLSLSFKIIVIYKLMRSTNVWFLKRKAQNSSKYDLKCKGRYVKETLTVHAPS